MIYGAFILAILGEIGLPIGIMLWLKRRYHVGWSLFGVGVLIFIAAQVVYIPLLAAMNKILMDQLPPYDASDTAIFLDALILGLLAGLCEETARLAGYWALKERAKSFGAALTLGAGYGGIESMGVGLSLAFTFVVNLLAIRSNQPVTGVTPQNATAIFAYPFYVPLISLFERLTADCLHLTLSVMVWQAVTRHAWRWYLGAVFYHAVVDGLAVALPLLGVSTFFLEGILGVFMLANLVFLYRINRGEVMVSVGQKGLITPI